MKNILLHSIFCSSYQYFEKTITGSIFFFLIQIWDQKWIYLEFFFQSSFLQFLFFPLGDVSLVLNSWIGVPLYFTLSTLTCSIWLTHSWSFQFLLHLCPLPAYRNAYNFIVKFAPPPILWLLYHICVSATLQLA